MLCLSQPTSSSQQSVIVMVLVRYWACFMHWHHYRCCCICTPLASLQHINNSAQLLHFIQFSKNVLLRHALYSTDSKQADSNNRISRTLRNSMVVYKKKTVQYLTPIKLSTWLRLWPCGRSTTWSHFRALLGRQNAMVDAISYGLCSIGVLWLINLCRFTTYNSSDKVPSSSHNIYKSREITKQ